MEIGYSVKDVEQKTAIFIAIFSRKILFGINDSIGKYRY